MRSLDRLDVEIQSPSTGVGTNCGISRVGERTRLSIAQAGDIVLVATEGLLGALLVAVIARQFELEGAELLVDDVPHDLVRRHGEFAVWR